MDLFRDDDRFQDDTAQAMQMCAQQLARVASALKALGNADAATPMGAIEAFGVVMKEGMRDIAHAITELADAIRDGH